MMRTVLIATLPVFLGLGCASENLEPRAAESRATVKAFMQTLKGELQAGMKAGGPVNAIAVCNEKAPQIAASVSEQKGWQVGRTSLKPRNPGNAPDAWETKNLQAFETRLAAGEKPGALETFEMVKTEDGKQAFRYMKAIPTGEVCLACHGEQIAPDVSEKLKALYPEDKATGYKAGELRGAFTITQPM